MKRKVLITAVCFILCMATVASASLRSLEDALAPLLKGQGAVKMSVKLSIGTLMPFDELRLDLINRVLNHTQLDLLLNDDPDDATTGLHLSLGGDTLFEISERVSQGAYLMQTSLLPNRMLFSTQASPMDTLLLSSQEEEAVVEESPNPNTSNVEEAFDMLSAMEEIAVCYRDLTNQTVPLTEKNSVSYSIDNIGKGRTSYVAKLTAEQCTELATQLRAVLSCGMDEEYREEISEIMFARGFTVALYQDADGQNICLYIKGTILYPDGDRRTLKWQWGFTPDGKTQTYLYRLSREEGRRDTRNIDAILTRTEDASGYSLQCETSVNLRRGGLNETSTLTIDLSGDLGDARGCKGSVIRETSGTNNGDDLDNTATEVTVDLILQPGETEAVLTGTASYQQITNKKVNTVFNLSFVQSAQTAQQDAGAAQNAQSNVEISILSADAAEAEQSAQAPTVTIEETQGESPDFLVGAPPVGLFDYEIPAEMITINMDNTQQKVHQSLMNEAAQRMAGNLVLAILNLSAEDRELLSDGMTEADYAIFLAMLD
ncbi:MAG TPA: hypothetical protein PKU80_05820 [Candidatus Limiplasma sp.]|nr:hypothetical protein [Candidatus Limiplasma sp.]HRX09200.1 hypothetical protein [Candidatus Limiplasma sp.]